MRTAQPKTESFYSQTALGLKLKKSCRQVGWKKIPENVKSFHRLIKFHIHDNIPEVHILSSHYNNKHILERIL